MADLPRDRGKSVGGRLRIDWEWLKKEVYDHGYTIRQLSRELGHAEGYLHTCKYQGGISPETKTEIEKILGISLDGHVFETNDLANNENVVDIINSKNLWFEDLANWTGSLFSVFGYEKDGKRKGKRKKTK